MVNRPRHEHYSDENVMIAVAMGGSVVSTSWCGVLGGAGGRLDAAAAPEDHQGVVVEDV